MPDRIPSAAAEQGGVFTAAQARGDGWTGRQNRRRLTAGRWQYVAGRAMAVPSATGWTGFQLALAAQLTFSAAVTTHLTAGELHGFPIETDARSHVTAMGVHRASRNMVIHRVPIQSDDVVCLDGLVMLTNPARTALDCLSIMDSEKGLRLWSWVSSRQILDARLLRRRIAERSGRPGVVHLRTLLELVENGAVSAAEYRCHQILHEAGIGGWSAGATIRDEAGVIAVADILFARQRLVVEIDGYAAHSSKNAFIRDRRRQNRLVAAGYTILRFTWDDLEHHPLAVIRRIRQALAAA